MDAIDYLRQKGDCSVDGVFYDPPYSRRQVKEMYEKVGMDKFDGKNNFWTDVKSEIDRIVRPGGKAILFGWNSVGVGNQSQWEKQKIMLVCHGGHHHDTIVTVEKKTCHQESMFGG